MAVFLTLLVVFATHITLTVQQSQVVFVFDSYRISLTPSTLASGTRVTMTCGPVEPAPTGYLSLNIQKKLQEGSNFTTLAYMDLITSKGQPYPTLSNAATPSMTTSGNFTSGRLILTFYATCADQGTYRCYVLIQEGDTGSTKTSVQYLPVEVRPGQLTMSTVPESEQQRREWTVGQTLTLKCQGNVGTLKSNEVVRWVWQRRESGTVRWTSLSGEAPITVDDPVPVVVNNASCSAEQTSHLQVQLTAESESQEYRCYIIRGSQSFQQFLATFSIRIKTVDTTTPSATTLVSDGPRSRDTTKRVFNLSTAGKTTSIVGSAGSVVLLAVMLCCAILYFQRRRAKKETERGEMSFVFAKQSTTSLKKSGRDKTSSIEVDDSGSEVGSEVSDSVVSTGDTSSETGESKAAESEAGPSSSAEP